MALMEFREPNQVKRVGTRPGHNGEQVIRLHQAVNGGVVIYTVPAGKTFYLCSCGLMHPAVAAGMSHVYARTGGGVLYFNIFQESPIANAFIPTNWVSFWPPVELPASYDVFLSSSAPGLIIRVSIFGWVE